MTSRPRVLRVDLTGLEPDGAPAPAPAAVGARPAEARPAEPRPVEPRPIESWRGAAGTPAAIDAIGSWSGTALALALVYEALLAGRAAPLVLAVGDCVRRGVPTAARASVVSRAPLTGRLADGQVGGDLGRRLASVTDALVIAGRAATRTGVLHVGAGGTVGLREAPELRGLSPRETFARLTAEFPEAAILRVGPAGELAVPFAVLAGAADPPSFVGRGGLGAVLGAAGLKAIVVEAPPVESAGDAGAEELMRALAGSPRLRARGEGGTLELVEAFRARGELAARNYSAAVDDTLAERAGAEREARTERKGCAGCPTPCGWVFEGAGARKQGAHFGAVYALGLNLGLPDFDDAVALLGDCDEAGVDAKEAGAVLALGCAARERGALEGAAPWGDREGLRALLADVVARRGDGRILARGASAAAVELGLEDVVFAAHGEAARPERNLAAVLGQCVASRGADPMRTFAFLVGEGVPRARRERLLDPLSLSAGADDPRDPTDKGRLVFWHENLMAAVDATGFCAFSTAGLLADGLCDLDELARWILPEALRDGGEGDAPGRRLLAIGASLVTLQRELARRFGARPEDERPGWAAAALEAEGMLSEYRRLRGVLEGEGEDAEAWTHLSRTSILDVGVRPEDLRRAAEEPAERTAAEAAARAAAVAVVAVVGAAHGLVRLRTFGPLARALGREAEFDLPLPASVVAVLGEVARRCPEARSLLVRDGEPVPAVYRGGERMGAGDLVAAGDRLDLVLAIAGG